MNAPPACPDHGATCRTDGSCMVRGCTHGKQQLLVPSNWNPHWNYHLGGEPRSICACPDGPYEGARLATIPRFCERCGGLVEQP